MKLNEFSRFLQRVRAFCEAEALLEAPAGRPLQLAAAVSGGADSMALLRLLLALQPEYGFALSACHVNHGLRGAAADRDEAFVRAACARLGVPLRVFCPADVGFAPPACPGEDWARQLRYACFERLRREGIDCIATAHTGTDQAETLLFRLARGTGLHGAAGIRPKRPGFCRPLLGLTRADTEAICRLCGESFVTDETNDSDAYARNRLRHAALPALVSVNGAAVENLARFCEKAAAADAYFAREAERLLTQAAHACPEALPAGARYARAAGETVYSLHTLQAADPLILEAALHAQTAPIRDAEEKYVRLLARLVRQGSGAVQLTDEVRFCAGGGVFWRESGPARREPNAAPGCGSAIPFCPADGAEYPLGGGKVLKIRVFRVSSGEKEEKIQGVHKKDLKNQADYARIMTLYPALTLRCRQPGDRFRPAGRGLAKELRKWMNEAQIPPAQRDALPLLAAGHEVVWVLGEGFAEGLAPTAATTLCMQIEPQKMEESKNDEYAR